MKSRLARFQFFCFALVGVILFTAINSIGWTQEVADRYQPVVGKTHEDFALPSIQDGSKIKLSDYRGKKIVLIHFASW